LKEQQFENEDKQKELDTAEAETKVLPRTTGTPMWPQLLKCKLVILLRH
jgi:hypothetical protein